VTYLKRKLQSFTNEVVAKRRAIINIYLLLDFLLIK